MRYMRNFVFAFMLVMAFPVSAGQWSGPVDVVDMQAQAGGFFIKFSEMLDEGCGLTTYIRMRMDEPHSDYMFSMILSSFTTNTPIRYYVNGCEGSHSKLVYLKFVK